MRLLVIMLFAIMFFIIFISINAIGFKISCRFFNKYISYFEAILILIWANICSIFYGLIILIPGYLFLHIFMNTYYTFIKEIAIIVGFIGFFKSLNNSLEVVRLKQY